MRKIISFINLKRIAIVVVIGIPLVFALNALDSIHYNIGGYIEYVFSWREPGVKFRQYEKEFELLVDQIYLFVDENPEFFNEFPEPCLFSEDGLEFYKEESDYPNNIYRHEVTAEGWAEAVNSYCYGRGRPIIRLNYISFVGGFTTLIYTRDGKYPQELMESIYKDRKALVIRHAKGWYEIIDL